MTVTMVVEQVHDRTGQQEQIRQRPQHVRSMFRPQKERCNGKKSAERPARTSSNVDIHVWLLTHFSLRC